MNEKEMRETTVPTFSTVEELSKYVTELSTQEHDYGTCCYAMSMAAVAAFNFMANKLGVTGFQASCADMDIIRRTSGLKRFKVVDLENLLYPQYSDKFLDFETEIQNNAKWLKTEALNNLKICPESHPNVIQHWKRLSGLSVPGEATDL
jgi:hypothetical protein